MLSWLANRLWKKGLIIAAVPLLFELIFVGVLAKIYRDMDGHLAQEKRAKDIIEHIQNIRDFSEQAAECLARYKHDERPENLQRYDGLAAAIPREIEIIKEVAEDQDQKRIVQYLENDANRAKTILSSYKESLQADNTLGQVAALTRAAQVGRRIRFNVDQLLAPYRQSEEAQYAKREADRDKLWKFLWFGVGLNFSIAAAMVAYFSTNISRRIGIVVDNTRKLAGKERLNEKVDGDDEVQLIDACFHTMSDQLSEAERKAQEIERLKQEFVSMVSHDLRSPLTSLQVTLDLLGDGTYGQLNETGQKRIEAASKSAVRLIGLINDLLDLEKMESGMMNLEIEAVRVTDLFEQAIAGVCGFAEQQGVILDQCPSNTIIKGDSERLVQVVVNLLSNAIKFSPAGSKIYLKEESTTNSMCRISVVDGGRGIPEAFRKQIFERFRQVKESDGQRKKGTGLGLPICKAIVQLHGGEIGVESQEGKGSTFWFSVPLAEKSQAQRVSV
jgi:signal transduction histidine kinase